MHSVTPAPWALLLKNRPWEGVSAVCHISPAALSQKLTEAHMRGDQMYLGSPRGQSDSEGPRVLGMNPERCDTPGVLDERKRQGTLRSHPEHIDDLGGVRGQVCLKTSKTSLDEPQTSFETVGGPDILESLHRERPLDRALGALRCRHSWEVLAEEKAVGWDPPAVAVAAACWCCPRRPP